MPDFWLLSFWTGMSAPSSPEIRFWLRGGSSCSEIRVADNTAFDHLPPGFIRAKRRFSCIICLWALSPSASRSLVHCYPRRLRVYNNESSHIVAVIVHHTIADLPTLIQTYADLRSHIAGTGLAIQNLGMTTTLIVGACLPLIGAGLLMSIRQVRREKQPAVQPAD